jgi:alanine racemase
MRDASALEIDLTAIDGNMRALRRLVGDQVGLCPVIKADAYGLGAARLAKRLVAAGASMLAVYTPEQAGEVIRAAAGGPILILMPIWEIDRTDSIYRYLVEGRLHLTVHGVDHLAAIDRIAWKYGVVIPLHLEIDTGMSRGGASPDEVSPMLKTIAKSRWLRVAGVCTQLASAGANDDSAEEQLALFKKVLAKHQPSLPGDCMIHAANSAATLRDPSFHCTMARIGIAWMGYGEELLECESRLNDASGLEGSVTWASEIVHVKRIERGDHVGYGRRWTAERATRLGLVPVGYADGYPSSCGATDAGHEGAPVAVHLSGGGKRVMHASVVGAINMDQIVIDVTDLPLGQGGVGTRVEIISRDRNALNSLPRVAKIAGLLPHEILARIHPRVRRLYLARPVEVETPAAEQLRSIAV